SLLIEKGVIAQLVVQRIVYPKVASGWTKNCTFT
ncbi:MAG: hypothetical protein ACI9JY_001857, partial [Saprospiraceae bacterium]